MKPSAGHGSRACPPGRAQLPARVRAHHPGQGAPGPVYERSGRPLPSRCHGTARAPPASSGSRGEDGKKIEILIVQALAHQEQGDILLLLCRCSRALTLAEPEGYVRIFIDEGPPMAALLAKLHELRGNGPVPPRRTFPWPTSNGSSHYCAENGFRRYLPCCTLCTSACPAAARPADRARIGSTAPHCGWPLQS